MPTVPWRLRSLALLAAPAWALAGGAQVRNPVATLLWAVYVAFWLAVPRAWSVALAVLTVPAALAASLTIEHSAPAIGLLWLYPAIALCYAVPETISVAALLLVCALAMIASFPIVGSGVTTGTPSWSWFWRELGHTILAVGLPAVAAGLAASTARRLLSATERLGRAQRQLAGAAVQGERAPVARGLPDPPRHSLTRPVGE